MTAERIALCGVVQAHDVEGVHGRVCGREHRRQDREVLRDVVGDRERRQRAARHEQLLADLDDLDQFGRIRIEIDHVRRLFGGLRAGVHRDADVGLGERRSVVRAVAGHRDEPARALLAPDQRHLRLGRGLGQEIVDAGFARDRRCGERVVAGDHDRANPHRAQAIEALLHVRLEDVFQMDDAKNLGVLGEQQRRAAGAGDAFDVGVELRLVAIAAAFANQRDDGVRRALADRVDLAVGGMSRPLMRVYALNGTNVEPGGAAVAVRVAMRCGQQRRSSDLRASRRRATRDTRPAPRDPGDACERG